MAMMTETLSRIRLVYKAAEQLIGPLLVFVISYAHHVYFADDFISSFFAGFSLVSLLLVMAVDKTGILLALGVQLAFLGWIMVQEPQNLLEQMLFSASVCLSLVACYFNIEEREQSDTAPDARSLIQQKEKLWQELFDARNEIKEHFRQKQELQETFQATLEATVTQKIAEAVHERDEKILFLQHHLEAQIVEKAHLMQDRSATEEDIKRLSDHIHEMALFQETQRLELLRHQELLNQPKEVVVVEAPKAETAKVVLEEKVDEEKPSHYESMYRQLKAQFEDKSKVLDDTRKELFQAQEEIGVYHRLQAENLEATPEEKRLMQELATAQERLDLLKHAHDEELVGYEEVIQGLLNQLSQKQLT